MDIQRKPRTGRKIVIRITIGVIIIAVVCAVSFYISRMEPAAPAVDGATIWVDTVKQGSMSRAIRGMGRLVPEEVRLIPATVDGLVERKVLAPGAWLKPDTVILELSNSQLERDTVAAEWDFNVAESGFKNFQLQLRNEALTTAADMVNLESDYEQAKSKYEVRQQLREDGLITALELQDYKVAVERFANRIELEKQRAEIKKESIEAQLFERRTQVDKSRVMYELRKSQLEQLNVTTGVEGILQELPVEVGQRIGLGTTIARVVNPNRLKVELSVSETQVNEIQVGLPVAVETRNGVAAGVVSRIDPAVKGGSVTIDVRFTGELPAGARPDLSVDGTIVLEQLDDVVYMAMPSNTQANSQTSVFRVSADGKTAERVNVRLGNTSVNTVEILEGLKPGDRVIMSDMSAHDGFDSIRLTN